MSEIALYKCENEHCHLGSRSEPGHFTGGLSELQALILTGNPEAAHGEGICPNCGEPGTEVGTHESVEGEDPYEEAHRAVALRVDDPDDKLKPKDAQKALEALVRGADSDA